MKRQTFSLLILVTAVLILCSWAWAACPEAPNDNGICDTLKVTCMDCTQPDTGSFYYIRFPMYVTHDVPNDALDSIAAMVIPLCYTRTNPTAFCSVSSYMNRILWSGSNPARSIFRHLPSNDDPQIHNWMMDLYDIGEGQEWDGLVLDLNSTPGNSHFWLTLIPSGSPDQRVGPISNVLMVTMTMKIQDTMHVNIDTCLWPPSSQLAFSRADAATYIPRHNLPHTFWIGPPRLQVLAPNGGEQWAQGSSHDISWLSENFTGATVKIEYSTNNGGAWTDVIASTANDGSYTWNPIPNTPSTLCLVKISNTAGGGVPKDSSDAVFQITAPDFSIAATPDTLTVIAGNSTSYTVNLGSLNGFSNAVTCSMRVIGLSTGITWDFTPNPVTPPGSSTMNVHTTTSTAAATYKLEVIGKYTSLIHKDTVTLIVTPVPDFTIRAEPGTREVVAGDSAKYNVILKYLNGFDESCDLTATGLPTGATAVFRPTPLVPPDTLSVLTVYTTAGVTPAGTSDITITATSAAKIAKQVHVSLVVHVPDFTIDATPETLVVRQGEGEDYTVTLTSLYGFSSACTLIVDSLPANVTGVFAPPNVTPTGASTLTITADLAAVVGKYPLIITGTKLSAKFPPVLAHSDTVILDLISQQDFNLAVIPDTLHISIGEDSSYRVKLIPVSGYNSPCSLTVTGLTTEITGSFAKPLLTPEDSTTLDISVSCNAEATTTTPHTLTVTATEKGRTLTHSKDVKLYIEYGTWDFKLQAHPDTQKVVVGDSTTYEVKIIRHPCFTLACTLSVESGLPVGAAYYFKPTIVPSNDSVSVLVMKSDTSLAGIYRPVIKGIAMSKVARKDTVTFVVQDFSVSSSPDTTIITQGQSAGYNISVNSLFGFAERCTLLVSGLPNLSNGVFDKATLIPTDNSFLNVYTEAGTDTGWYDITVTARRMTAKSTVLEHSHIIVLRINESSDVGDEQDNPNAPKTFALFQNQPNPFNPVTQISYYLPKASLVQLTVYNILGQSVRVLYDGYQEAGTQTVAWDGRSEDGNELSSGIYFYRLKAGDFNQTKKMSLMK